MGLLDEIGISTQVSIPSCLEKLLNLDISLSTRKDIARSIDIDGCDFNEVVELLENPEVEYEIKKLIVERVKHHISFIDVKSFLSNEDIDTRLRSVIAKKIDEVSFEQIKGFLEDSDVDDEIKEYVIDKIIGEELTQEHFGFLKNRNIDAWVRLSVGTILDEERFRGISTSLCSQVISNKIEKVLGI